MVEYGLNDAFNLIVAVSSNKSNTYCLSYNMYLRNHCEESKNNRDLKKRGIERR